MITRRISKQLRIGTVAVGGGAPISVQSMTNTDTRDVVATTRQIHALEDAGCEIVRVAVPDIEAAYALPAIKAGIRIPLIADIHFDYRLALAALEAGLDGLRLNPGNISDPEKVKTVVKAAKARSVPIRIGVNAGSLPRQKSSTPRPPSSLPRRPESRRPSEPDRIWSPAFAGTTEKPDSGEVPTVAERMVALALEQVRLLESLDFDLIKLSLKAFDVPTTVEAYSLMARAVPYPLHLGITEAGTPWAGSIRSAVGIGAMLSAGIGDTLRVSLTGDPVEEVRVGYEILKSLDLRQRGAVMVSCPTCGRTEIDLLSIAREVEAKLQRVAAPVKVAVMGCVVNGPGEARDADVGIAGGAGRGVLFRNGEVVRTMDEADLLPTLLQEIDAVAAEWAAAERSGKRSHAKAQERAGDKA